MADEDAGVSDLVGAVQETARALVDAAAAADAPEAHILLVWSDVATNLSSLLYKNLTVAPDDVGVFIVELGKVRDVASTGRFVDALTLSKPVFERLAALPGDPIIDES